MTAPVLNRRAERFAQLLDEAAGARRHHVRSPADPSLAPLVTIGERLTQLQPRVEMDPDFRTGLRAMLVATAERNGIGVTDVDPAERLTSGTPQPTARRARTRAAIIVGIAAGTLALSGMSAASGDAMPGDALYGIKRSTEKAQLALATTDANRGELYLEFAKTRVNEARAVNRDSTGLAPVLVDMDTDTRQGVKLLTTAAVDRRDPAALDAVDRFVGAQQRNVAELLNHDAPGARERVLESLALLDAVNRRTAALRFSLTCAGARQSDLLGPLPTTCGTAAPRVGTEPTDPMGTASGVSGGRAHQAGSAGGLTSGGEAPQADPATGAPPSQEASEDADPDLLDQLGRILGGILG